MSEPGFLPERMKLIAGDCLTQVKLLEIDSVDSLVTDPPAGISFMGKEWDSDKGGRDGWIKWMSEVMRECLRVLKPGAHGLIWALPRTSHWTATALEDAGFEIRDVICHLFGQGFPKSLDISKAIDKAAGAERAVLRDGFTSSEEQGGTYAKGLNAGFRPRQLTSPTSPQAKLWQGWGTSLKPAVEHWILVRKPCSEKTVAANVIKWGTGGLNIDGSRIGTGENTARPQGRDIKGGNFVGSPKASNLVTGGGHEGRFPANLVLSHSPHCEPEQCDIECAVLGLDAQSGISQSNSRKSKGEFAGYGSDKLTARPGYQLQDTGGGASRFFYCAKISTSERGEGNTHPTVKPQKLMRYLIKMITPTGGLVLDPFMGSGSTGMAALAEGFRFIGIEKEPEYLSIAQKRTQPPSAKKGDESGS